MRKTIITIVLFVFTLQGFPQDNYTNLIKYWSYRERLKYFVVPGIGSAGLSCVVTERRTLYPDEELGYADQTQHLGWYIGVLATEYKLLQIYGGDTRKTLKELYYAMEAYKRLDMCESMPFPLWDESIDKLDGFFMRQDVPNDFCTNYLNELNEGIDPSYKWGNAAYVPGDIAYVNSPRRDLEKDLDEMSQDNAIYLMIGFSLVKRLLPYGPITIYDENNIAIHNGYNFVQKSIDYASLMINYIGKDTGKGRWMITNPDGNKVSRGPNARAFSYGFNKAYKYFNGVESTYNNYWGYTVFNNSGLTTDNRNMMSVLGTIGNVWAQSKLKQKTDNHNWHPFFLMLSSVLHSSSNYFNIITDQDLYYDDAVFQINEAPCQGPFHMQEFVDSVFIPNGAGGYNVEYIYTVYNPYTIDGVEGWSSTLKYAKDKNLQKEGSKRNIIWGTYNGLDYMLVYNLFHLMHYQDLPSYLYHENINETRDFPICMVLHPFNIAIAKGNTSNPITIKAISTISTDSYISASTNCLYLPNDAGHVSMVSGKKIVLKPGFKVENGAYFSAKIKPIKYEGCHLSEFTPLSNGKSLIMSNITQMEDSSEIKNAEVIINQEIPEGGEIKISPNPAKNEIRIQALNIQTQTNRIEIMDINGRMLDVFLNCGNSTVVDVSGYQTGICFVRFVGDNSIFIKQFIKQ